MSASPTCNEAYFCSPLLEYAPRSPFPDTPSFPVAITTETGIPISRFGTPQIVHAPSPQLTAASPLPPSPPPLQIPPWAPSNNSYHVPVASPHHIWVLQTSQLAAEVAAKTHLNSTLHSAHTPISPRSVANILQSHADIPTGDL